MIAQLILLFFVSSALTQQCNIRETEFGSVCVCNAKYCDTVPELDTSAGKYQIYSTTKDRLGFGSKIGSFVEHSDAEEPPVTVNRSTEYQKIIGFGGSFTDSTGINIKLLPEEVQEKLLQSYFSKSGIEYSLCRVPIGGTDFSTRGYSYDDVAGDDKLEHFALQQDDFDYKIPFIQQANKLRGSRISLFSSPWSAPTWMKTNNDWAGIGILKDEYYQTWADYILKFYEEYEKNNITFWGMTTQNEPVDGFIPKSLIKINSMGWMPWQMNQWISANLGPTIRNSKYKDLKIMLHDDSRITLPLLMPLLDNETTMSYADGAAVHWYSDFFIPPRILDLLKTDKKDWFFISSEASSGYLTIFGLDKPVELGSWKRGEGYVKDIFENLQHGAGGWVDWNMVLDETGGPTYIDNLIDSPVIVNKTHPEFYKQPMFYAMGHFSKFVVPESVRVETTVDKSLKNVKAMAFLRPDNLTALIVFNSGDEAVSIKLQESETYAAAVIEIEARSINTVLYQ